VSISYLSASAASMAMRVQVCLVLAGLALLAAPSALAQLALENPTGPTPVTLHLHTVGVQSYPINTQAPDYGFRTMPGRALAGHTLSCLPAPPLVGGPFYDLHTVYGYSSPSYVFYEDNEEGRPRVYPERQMGYDVQLDDSFPSELTFFLATTEGTPGDNGVPVVLPNVVVEATLRIPDSLSLDDAGFDTGPVLAHGKSPPALLAAAATQGATHSMAGIRHVYGFTVPLGFEDTSIPRDRGFTLRIDVFVENPLCAGEGHVAPNLVEPYADPAHSPAITTWVLQPLRIGQLTPHFIGHEVVVVGEMQSAWGNYDVDESSIGLRGEGPDGPVDVQVLTFVQRTREHGHHSDPVEVAWLWNRTGASPGIYTFSLHVANDQGTATAWATAAVRLGPDAAFPAVTGPSTVPAGEAAVPAAAWIPTLGILALAGGSRRLFGNR
jgi:hypothetical protein